MSSSINNLKNIGVNLIPESERRCKSCGKKKNEHYKMIYNKLTYVSCGESIEEH